MDIRTKPAHGTATTGAASATEPAARPQRVLMLRATGTAGRAVTRALIEAGHDVVCVLRPCASPRPPHPGADARPCDVTDPGALARAVIRGGAFDALVSCLASRTGAPGDAWALDYQAHSDALRAAKRAGIGQFVLVSAICVQKPVLAFQKAKRAFEEELIASGLTYSIVRPTAFFKSLSGQIGRIRQGKPYLMFGNGRLTACKPIGDADLGRYVAACLTDPDRRNRILPIGGPGPALTPEDQARALFDLTGRPMRTRRVPVALLNAAVALASGSGRFRGAWADRAEFARIARYYATESMLVWDADAKRYDAAATPETGRDTLFDHYARTIASGADSGLREHALF